MLTCVNRTRGLVCHLSEERWGEKVVSIIHCPQKRAGPLALPTEMSAQVHDGSSQRSPF